MRAETSPARLTLIHYDRDALWLPTVRTHYGTSAAPALQINAKERAEPSTNFPRPAGFAINHIFAIVRELRSGQYAVPNESYGGHVTESGGQGEEAEGGEGESERDEK